MAALELRRATPADAATIAGLQVRGSDWAYRALLPPNPLPAEERLAQRTRVWLTGLAPDGERRSFLAEEDGVALGFVTCGSAEDAGLVATGEVFAIYLEPHAVGRGVGRALFAHAVADLTARGFHDAVLWVLEGNERARRFYERAGWATDGARKDYERNGALRHEVRYRSPLGCA